MLSITFIGKSSVGKTKIINRLITDNDLSILPSATQKNTAIVLDIYDNNNNINELYLNKKLLLSTKNYKDVWDEIEKINTNLRNEKINCNYYCSYDDLFSGYKLYTKINTINRKYYQKIFFQDTPGLDDEMIKSELDFFVKKIINSSIIYYIFSFDRLEDEIMLFKNVLNIIKNTNPNCLGSKLRILINKIDLIHNKINDNPYLDENKIISNHNELIKNAFKEISKINYVDDIIRISTTDKEYNDSFNFLINDIDNYVCNRIDINKEHIISAVNKIKSEIVINYNVLDLNDIILDKINEHNNKLYQEYKDIKIKKNIDNNTKNANINKLIYRQIINDPELIRYPINVVFRIYKENFSIDKIFERSHTKFVGKIVGWWNNINNNKSLKNGIIKGLINLVLPNDILNSINDLCHEKNNLENSMSYGVLNSLDKEYLDDLDCCVHYDDLDNYSESDKIFIYHTNEDKYDSKIKAKIIGNKINIYNPKGEQLYSANIDNNVISNEKYPVLDN